MVEQWLWITGAAIYILLAGIHLLYTFFSNKFSVRDTITEERMKNTYPVLTNKTTMWKAWIGFNGSHSIGGLFFGIINLYFASCEPEWLFHSWFMTGLTCLTSIFYLFLGFRFWFIIPRTGILVSTICFLLAVILIFVP